jgi:hypothetical protein
MAKKKPVKSTRSRTKTSAQVKVPPVTSHVHVGGAALSAEREAATVRLTLSMPVLVVRHGEMVAARFGMSVSALFTLLLEEPLEDLRSLMEANPNYMPVGKVAPVRLTVRSEKLLRTTVEHALQRARSMQGQLEL